MNWVSTSRVCTHWRVLGLESFAWTLHRRIASQRLLLIVIFQYEVRLHILLPVICFSLDMTDNNARPNIPSENRRHLLRTIHNSTSRLYTSDLRFPLLCYLLNRSLLFWIQNIKCCDILLEIDGYFLVYFGIGMLVMRYLKLM